MIWRTCAQQVLIDGASREDGGGVMGLFFVGGSGVVVRMALGGRNECRLGEFFVLGLAYGFAAPQRRSGCRSATTLW